MGCDIHWYMEKKKSGKWELLGELIKEESPIDHIEDEPCYIQSPTDHMGRDYNLFAVLTGNHVRARSQNTPALPEPRGLPSDICKEIKIVCDQYGIDGHSHTYFTLKELEEFFITPDSMLGIPTDLIPIGTLNKNRHQFPDMERVINIMREYLSEVGDDSERIRAVFWFDN